MTHKASEPENGVRVSESLLQQVEILTENNNTLKSQVAILTNENHNLNAQIHLLGNNVHFAKSLIDQ